MKKIKYLVLIMSAIAFFVAITDMPIRLAHAEDNGTSPENIGIAIDDIIDTTDLSDYEKFVSELELLNEKYSVKNLIDQILNNSFELDLSYFLSFLTSCFFGNIKGMLGQMLIIVIIAVLMSILNNLTSEFAKTSTKKIVYIACYGAVIAVICVIVAGSVKTAVNFFSNIEKFNNIVFPILLTLVTAIGATATISVYQPIILIFSSVIIKIVNYIVMPAFFISFVFNIIGHLSDDLKLNKISDVAKSSCDWIIGIAFGFFVTFITARGITGAGIDSLATKGAKYALGNYVPIIGNYLKDGFDIITAGCIVVKNAIGFVSTVILILMAATPITHLVSAKLILKLCAALCEPFTDKKLSDMLSGVSKSLTMPLVACIATVFSVLIIIMLIILTCNRGVI